MQIWCAGRYQVILHSHCTKASRQNKFVVLQSCSKPGQIHVTSQSYYRKEQTSTNVYWSCLFYLCHEHVRNDSRCNMTSDLGSLLIAIKTSPVEEKTQLSELDPSPRWGLKELVGARQPLEVNKANSLNHKRNHQRKWIPSCVDAEEPKLGK
ncbi:hypothetical protein PoB_001687300 [Plakobranchus ocellatus]|uniref:FLYWCH-type domain-containing protein n=1 Tax=Plakobranchus ocellatus TaxID=259542 RepID=A0AAV3Z7C0_9GAST|nr:hypothetical protein PoB_001687300 [Plakobranchus ocellatus]